MTTQQPSTRSVLQVLVRARLNDLARDLAVSLQKSATKDQGIEALLESGRARFGELLRMLGREELRAACRAHGLDDSGRARQALAARLMEAHGAADSIPPPALFVANDAPAWAPRMGDVVVVRHRQWLVQDLHPPTQPTDSTLVELVCLDDDAQGDRLDVLWELELGARVRKPEAHGLGDVAKIDPPRHFSAYLHALQWNAVTATDAKLFQSPFRAGIKLLQHQLTPLKKALRLPRANLFIADDVGLGKTIEAGLVLQELVLRQRVDFALVVCPASICLQWQSEMEKRFGLRFEIHNRAFVARCRRERGFAVNTWKTYPRFIISYPLLRRPEYREPLLAHLGTRAAKSLLVLDEAHTAAPASAAKYAVDSDTTKFVRDLAPRFENRLFLSATPHNGHSNSFSALLEILDGQRFTRGVPVKSTAELSPVMVRRLKSDLLNRGLDFPERQVVGIPCDDEPAQELTLARMLADYTREAAPKKGRARLVFVNLQKRLLSSVEAFYRTLQLHAKNVGYVPDDDDDEDEYGFDAETDVDEEPEPTASGRLAEMLRIAARTRVLPDAKARHLLSWIRENPDRRVIVFTEYGDTKRWLLSLFRTALQDEDAERVLAFHGGMSDDQREDVQRRFNSPLKKDPVRVLVATDAAREGLNLHGACADLFHFDIPWNPARMEQRNGRIDRTLQPAKIVRCHYFLYPARAEDAVLAKLVQKIDVIRRELGSLGAVVADRITDALARGIDAETTSAIDEAESLGGRTETAKEELESQRIAEAVTEDLDENGRILERSRDVTDFDPAFLRDAIDVGLELAGLPALAPKAKAYLLPDDFPDSWQQTLDSLRPPRTRDQDFWAWRKIAPQPVVFDPPDRLDGSIIQLHLQHPFVKRILDRFLAQGWAAHDLGRVTVVKSKTDHVARVIAFGRLSLFGKGATRLHDELVPIAAQWFEGGGEGHLRPFEDRADRRALDSLSQLLREAAEQSPVSQRIQDKLLASAPKDFATLFAHIRDEADARGHAAEQKLAARGAEESQALRGILESQKSQIQKELTRQLSFADVEGEERAQWEADKKHMRARLDRIDDEIAREPAEIRALYEVTLRRLEPVGLVYLWPETKG